MESANLTVVSRRHALRLGGSALLAGFSDCVFGLDGMFGTDASGIDIFVVNENTVHSVTLTVDDPNTGGFEETIELDADESKSYTDAVLYSDASRDLQLNVGVDNDRTATHEFSATPGVQRLEVTITEQNIAFETIKE